MRFAAWSGEPWEPGARGYAEHRARHGDASLSRQAWDARFVALREVVAAGRGDAVSAHVQALGLPWPPAEDRSRWPAHPPASDAMLARLSLDRAPAAGEDAPRAFLGPFAAGLDPHDPPQQAAWVAAVAASVFCVHDQDTRPPFRSWSNEKRKPTFADREAVVAVSRAPLAVWRLGARRGDAFEVTPVQPLGPGWVPDGPVSLQGVGGVDGEARQGGALLGRLVRAPEGWRPSTAVVLPRCPPDDLVWGWTVAETLSLYVAMPSLTLDDLLRHAGHRVCGRAHTWWWARCLRDSSVPGSSAPPGCP